MKSKKSILIGIGSVVIIMIISFLIIFLHKIKNTETTVSIELNGSWKVITKLGEHIDDEIIEFDENKCKYYKNDDSNLILESSYSLDNDRLELKEASKVFYIAKKTDNYMVFIDDSDKSELNLIKNSSTNVDKEWLIGDWDVVLHGGTLTNNEKVIFEKDTIKVFKNGESSLSITSTYSWKNDKTIFSDLLNMDIYLYCIDDSTLMMKESNEGYVWELIKK